MKKALLVVLLVALVAMPLAVEANDEDTIKKLDEQIASYTQRIDQARTGLEKGKAQLEQLGIELQQLIGARYSLQQLKQELLKPAEEVDEQISQ